mmetsp:Transcript_10124/g.11170  ORF Transcript_10124/g.11170 Transcript_10124/m.11170 type:complete len:88 (-) Transcript_10124:89-352(-)
MKIGETHLLWHPKIPCRKQKRHVPYMWKLSKRSGECRNDDNSFIHSWMNDSGGGGDVRGNSCGGDVNRSKKEEEEQQQQVSIVSVSL